MTTATSVRIWTAQRTVITSLRKKPDRFHEIASGFHGTTEWAEFSIPVAHVNWSTLAKRMGSSNPDSLRGLRNAQPTSSSDRTRAA